MAEATVHVGGRPWTWFVTSRDTLVLRDPDRKKRVVKSYIVREFWLEYAGRQNSHDAWEGVTPGMVKKYIEIHLYGGWLT